MLGEIYDPRTGAPIEAVRYTETMEWDRRSLGTAITAGQLTNYFTREGGVDLRDTSMVTAGQVPAGEEWIIATIQVVPPAAINRADLVLLMDNALIRVIRQDVRIYQAPLQYNVAGTGIAGATTATAEQFVSLGTPSPMAVLPFSTGIVLPALVPWRIEFNSPDAVTLSAARLVEIGLRVFKAQIVDGMPQPLGFNTLAAVA